MQRLVSESQPPQRTAREILADALKDRPGLVDAAVALFDLAQFLLDDDERLTKSGALDGVGREQIQVRAIEILGGPAATDPDDVSDDDEDRDDDDGGDDEAGSDRDGDTNDSDNDNDGDGDGGDDDDDDDDEGAP